MLSNRTTYINLEKKGETVEWVKSDKDNSIFEIAPMTRKMQYQLAKIFKDLEDIEIMFDIISPNVTNNSDTIQFENIDVVDLRAILEIWWSNSQLSNEEITRFLS